MKTTKQKFNYLFSLFSIVVLMIFATGSDCLGKDKKSKSDEEENKKLVKTYYTDFWNNHNNDSFDKYITTDFVAHFADGDQNYEQYKGLCKAYLLSFPDIHFTTTDIIAEGDKVVKIWAAKATNKTDFMGIPATGKQVVVQGIHMFRIEDGRIAELWASMDNLGMLQQLGVIPKMGE